MQSKELRSWASSVIGREIHTDIRARAYDSSTQPSIHITSFLWWQTAPQPFVIITEPFQLKDKKLWIALILPAIWQMAMGQLSPYGRTLRGQGRAHPPLPSNYIIISGGHIFSSFWGAKDRQWSCAEQDGSSSWFPLHCTTGDWCFLWSGASPGQFLILL